jgi:hypothetical protein
VQCETITSISQQNVRSFSRLTGEPTMKATPGGSSWCSDGRKAGPDMCLHISDVILENH